MSTINIMLTPNQVVEKLSDTQLAIILFILFLVVALVEGSSLFLITFNSILIWLLYRFLARYPKKKLVTAKEGKGVHLLSGMQFEDQKEAKLSDDTSAPPPPRFEQVRAPEFRFDMFESSPKGPPIVTSADFPSGPSEMAPLAQTMPTLAEHYPDYMPYEDYNDNTKAYYDRDPNNPMFYDTSPREYQRYSMMKDGSKIEVAEPANILTDTAFDDRAAATSQWRAKLFKRSIDGHTRKTVDFYKTHFGKELDDTENTIWWS